MFFGKLPSAKIRLSKQPPRLGVLSNEKLSPWVNWTTLGPPFLLPLAEMAGGKPLAPPPFAWRERRDWLHTVRQVRSCDTLFWMQGASHPEWPVFAATVAGGMMRRSALVIDAWPQLIPKIGAMAMLQRLDPCFVAFREGVNELRSRFPRGRFEWLPFGVDTTVFAGGAGERPIFALSMGRRHEPLHQALLQYCADRGLEYRFTQRPGEFPDPADLGRLVGQSKYFLVGPPDLSHPERTGGFSPFVMRYLEGLAAGARLLGVLPRSGEYERLLPMDAILTVASDGFDLAARLDADRDDDRVWSAIRRAQLLVREEHSWHRRAEQVFEYLVREKALPFE